jgi:hypothetical protein
MSQKKKALLATNVPARKVPTWPELAMKLIYPQVIDRHPDLLEYLPDIGGELTPRLPERDFFYRILNAQHEATYLQLISEAAAKRAPITKNMQDEQWALAIKPEWME